MTIWTQPRAHDCAGEASLRALLNGYIREIDPGALHLIADTRFITFSLSHSQAKIRVKVDYNSTVGPHHFGHTLVKSSASDPWKPASSMQVMTLISQECFARSGGSNSNKLPEFMRRLFNSYDQIEKIVSHQMVPAQIVDFIQAEQALAYGHWLHPTPKSREGMTDWHQKTFAPEFGGQFQLAFFAVNRAIVSHNTADRSAIDLVQDIPGIKDVFAVDPDEIILPAHPLQAEALRLDPAIQSLFKSGKLRELGAGGPMFSATSSLRTLYATDCPWMLKFSIPVQVTNSRRVTLRNELDVGVTMARLLKKLDFAAQQPRLRIIDDPAYLTVEIPGQAESGFEVIFRQNPFMTGADAGIFNLAALTADPLPGDTALLTRIVKKRADQRGEDLHHTALSWFDAYLSCMLDPMLELYDQHGIALEAHQQNSLLDVRDGLPTCAYYRDNQGYFIDTESLPKLCAVEPSLSDITNVAFDRSYINERFAYYLFVNQIFAVIRRLGCDDIIPEHRLLRHLTDHLKSLAPRYKHAAADFVDYLLTSPHIASKANLLTRIHDVDELETQAQEGLFLQIPNPMIDTATPAERAYLDAAT